MAAHLRLYTSRWEGVYAAGFSLDQVRQRCYALADELLSRGWSCIVACDTRFMSNLFAREVYRVFQARGVVVSLCPTPAPLPAVQHALNQRRASCALVVSARNQPYWYNGLVLISAQPEALLQGNGIPTTEETPFPLPETTETTQQDLRGPYLELLRAQIDIDLVRRSTLTLFVDPMHGTSAGYIPAAIGEGGQTKAIEINRETDPLFGKNTPQPVGAPLTRLRKLVRESDSHVGLALSADSTALNVVDKSGDSLDPAHLALLLASYLARQHRQRGTVVVPATQLGQAPGINAWQDALGIKVLLANDPAQQMSDLFTPDHASLLVGCTAEGELVIGRMGPYADGVYAALLTVEMLARSGGNLRALATELQSALAGKP